MTTLPPEEPLPGGRRNALRAERYEPLADVDTRAVPALLDALEDAGVAALAQPSSAAVAQATLLVDAERTELAEAVLRAELPGVLADLAPPVDESPIAPAGPTPEQQDEAFAQIVASWDTPASSEPVAPWPVTEDVDADAASGGRGDAASDGPRRPVLAEFGDDDPEDDDERVVDESEGHWTPPPPPPAPSFGLQSAVALGALGAGVLLIVVLPLLGQRVDSDLQMLGVLMVVGGIAGLVYRMRDAPPIDDGPDDGAVV